MGCALADDAVRVGGGKPVERGDPFGGHFVEGDGIGLRPADQRQHLFRCPIVKSQVHLQQAIDGARLVLRCKGGVHPGHAGKRQRAGNRRKRCGSQHEPDQTFLPESDHQQKQCRKPEQNGKMPTKMRYGIESGMKPPEKRKGQKCCDRQCNKGNEDSENHGPVLV